jgi:hypothetical protein
MDLSGWLDDIHNSMIEGHELLAWAIASARTTGVLFCFSATPGREACFYLDYGPADRSRRCLAAYLPIGALCA